MKNLKILSMFVAIATLSMGNILGAENTKSAVDQILTKEISEVFRTAPLGDLLEEDTETIQVLFQITPDREFKLVSVSGDNKDLVRYSTLVLNRKRVDVDPSVEAKFYEVPVKFVCK